MYTKKINTPITWYKRYSKKYVISLNPGKPKTLSIPLGLIIKQIVNEPTTKLRKLVRTTNLLVNNKIAKTINYPVMLLDLIKYNEKTYRVIMKNKRLVLQEETSNEIYLRIDKFKKYDAEKYQSTLNNGFTLISQKPVYKFVKYNIETKNFTFLNLLKGDKVIVTKGKYLGCVFDCISIEPLILNNEQFKNINLDINQIIKLETWNH